MCAPTSGPHDGPMETSWNATQQLVTDHRTSLESAARDRRLVKRPRRNRRRKHRPVHPRPRQVKIDATV